LVTSNFTFGAAHSRSVPFVSLGKPPARKIRFRFCEIVVSGSDKG